ncbi:MAG: type 4 fimbrial assembly protein PilB, type pilus assembly protein PilB [Candidatus Parcubacteria bacterium]|jgi:type IV pilus assembly protein PilB
MATTTLTTSSKLVEQELSLGEALSIINLVDRLIDSAHHLGASDIHIDPLATGVRVRLRIDGVLHDSYHFPKEVQSEVVSRVKVIASLRTDEHQATQDGRFRHTLPNNQFVDVRVSIAPTYYGENIVMRLLFDNTSQQFSLNSLGFAQDDQKKIVEAIHKSSGMILVTGPTGSGKTTTLYTLIQMLNAKEISLVTIEDPIEYAIAGVKQIQVNPRAGLTFANGLRTILRQDPNVIMVGEIRDSETAAIAINTALTGHLLLSTLHTNNAATTLPRLLDMKVESFLVASTINLAIGQRLVRRICDHCKVSESVTPEMVKSLASLELKKKISIKDTFSRGVGCGQCGMSGFSGRLCICEVLVVDNKMREAILRRASSVELKTLAVEGGMRTMLEDGFAKVRAGLTTPEEILRVIHE